MAQQPSLQQLVAGILRVDPDRIQDSTSLEPLAGSLNRAKLAFALQRLGRALPDRWIPGTFGELARFASDGSPSAETMEAPPKPEALSTFALPVGEAAGTTAGLDVGLDLEKIANLPEAADYWEHEFYRKVFTRAELAYCLMAGMPRTHLAGFWCAKEALRKCGDHLLRLDLNSIEVSHNTAGRPLLRILESGEWRQIPAALSISHTEDMAMAVVVMHTPQAPARAEASLAVAAPPPTACLEPVTATPQPQQPRVSRAVSIAIALIGLMALIALLRTFGQLS